MSQRRSQRARRRRFLRAALGLWFTLLTLFTGSQLAAAQADTEVPADAESEEVVDEEEDNPLRRELVDTEQIEENFQQQVKPAEPTPPAITWTRNAIVVIGLALLAVVMLRSDRDRAHEEATEELAAALGVEIPSDVTIGGNAGSGAEEAGKFGQALDNVRGGMVRAVEAPLRNAGWHGPLAKKLELAASQMRPAEWVLLVAVSSFVAFGITWSFLSLPLGLAVALVVAGGFYVLLNMKVDKRQKAFADQLPDTLQLLAGAMRSGTSLPQAMSSVAAESESPTAEEFARVLTENRLGRDMVASLRDMGERLDSADFRWVVNAMEVHREVGGDLAQILERSGATIRSRNRVRGQVRALSAEGRFSGILLGSLPPVMLIMLQVINPDYMGEMVGDARGQIMLGAALTLIVMGSLWIRKLVQFKF